MVTDVVEEILNLLGIAAFALSGATLGVRRQFDIVGMAVLATVTALGGGLIRDALIGATPAEALLNPWWLVIPLLATVVTFFWHQPFRRALRRAVELFDAVGLGVFCVTATVKAVDYGVTPLAAVLLGSITGVGGGILRDVLAGIPPAVLRKDSRLYAVPAVAGSAVVAAAASLGPVNVWAQAVAAGLVTVVRIMALWRGWTAPVPRIRTPES